MKQSGTGNRECQLSAYVDEELYEEVSTMASDNGISKSAFVARVLEQYVREDLYEQTSRETQAEQRILELAQDASEAVAASSARSELYLVAIWELIKEDYDEDQRRDAIDSAFERADVDPDQSTSKGRRIPFEAHLRGGDD